jgi:xanthine phosphoribosyltransferase
VGLKMEPLDVSWDEFQYYCLRLADKLDPSDYQRIVAVARGGLVAASIISYVLNIRRIETVSIVSYNNKHQQDYNLKILSNCSLRFEGDLIIDDIVDSGNTIDLVKRLHPGATTASIFVKEGKEKLVDFYSAVTSVWVNFPWEDNSK